MEEKQQEESTSIMRGIKRKLSATSCSFRTLKKRAVGSFRRRSTVKKEETLLIQNEYLYKELIKTVMNPLGNPNYHLKDMANLAKNIFEVPKDEHSRIIDKLKSNKQKSVTLTVTIKNVQPTIARANQNASYFCVASLNHFQKSPRSTPSSSPLASRKSHSIQDLHSCSNLEEDSQRLEVNDQYSDKLIIAIYADTEKLTSTALSVEKTSSFRRIFKSRQQSDYKRSDGVLLGLCCLKVSDIPANGYEKWHKIYEDRKQRGDSTGKILMNIALSPKSLQHEDSVESDILIPADDFVELIRRAIIHMVKSKSPSNKPDFEQSYSTLIKNFALHQRISVLATNIVQLTVYLELSLDEETRHLLSEKSILACIAELKVEWEKAKNLLAEDELERSLVEDHLVGICQKFLEERCKTLNSLPVLFPLLSHEQADKVIMEMESYQTVSSILQLPFGREKFKTTKDEYVKRISEKLKNDVKSWIEERLKRGSQERMDQLRERHKDEEHKELVETCILRGVLEEAYCALYPVDRVQDLESILLIPNYYKMVACKMSDILSPKCESTLYLVNEYQIKYQNHMDNIAQSEKAT